MPGSVWILIAQALAAYGLVLGAHYLRRRFSLAPFYALMGWMSAIMWWVNDTGLRVEVAGITFLVGSAVFFTALLLGVLIVYVFDGLKAARVAMITIVGVAVMAPLVALVLIKQAGLPGAKLNTTIPISSFRIYGASILAMVIDFLFLSIFWEFLNRRFPRSPLGLRVFSVLLGVMWLDVLVFVSGAFWDGPYYWGILKGNLIRRFLLALFVSPVAALYLHWHHRAYGVEIRHRPLLSLLGRSAQVEQELSLARQEIERRKRAEEALRQERDLKKTLVDSSPAFFVAINAEGRTVMMNEAMLYSLGYGKEEVVNTDYLTTFVPEADREKLERLFRTLVEKNEPTLNENRVLTKDGRELLVEWHGRPVFKPSGEFDYFFGLGIDVTDRKGVEEALRVSQARLAKAQEVAQIGNWEIDIGPGNVVPSEMWASQEAFKIYGIDYQQPDTTSGEGYASVERVFNAVHEEDREAERKAFFDLLKTGAHYDVERRILRNTDGALVWIRSRAELVRDQQGVVKKMVGTIQDITDWKLAEEERERLQAQLVQAQKMEAVGTLAGGIAHDFNNILGAIVGYAELSLYELPEDHPVRANLVQVLSAGERAGKLVRQILSFSRRVEQEQEPCLLAPIVKEALKLMRATLPTTIEISQDIDDESGTVMADPTQIHQVIMNLCANAAHAMQDGGGLLAVSLGQARLDDEDAAGYVDLSPGSYLRLTVDDTGVGMDKGTVQRIFEPFFTTKEGGGGTGLGLSVVHGIVKSHGGAITVYSEPGAGSTFHVYLPLLQAEAEDLTVRDAAPIPTGVERVLFVDDEPALVELGRQMLKRLGYEVTAVGSSLEALELFQSGPDKFDLVITDMTMPRMTGLDLSGELRRIRPEVPIILCTGFSAQISADNVRAAGIDRMLMKPLVLGNVAEVIRSVLDHDER